MIFSHRDTSNKPGGRSIEFHKYLNRSYLFTRASQFLDLGGFRTPHVKHIGTKKIFFLEMLRVLRAFEWAMYELRSSPKKILGGPKMRFSESASFQTSRTAKKIFRKNFFFPTKKNFFFFLVQKFFFFGKPAVTWLVLGRIG